MVPRRVPGRRWSWTVLTATTVLALTVPSAAATTLGGFVTKVDSPTEFQISALRVRIDSRAACFRERRTSCIVARPANYLGLWNKDIRKSQMVTPCESLSLKVGSWVQVTGDKAPQDGSFTATQMTMYDVTVREGFTNYGWNKREWAGGALLEEKPQLSRTGDGWAGTLWLDGYPLRIGAQTRILAAPHGTRMGYGFFKMSEYVPHLDAMAPNGPAPSVSAGLFAPGVWAAYRARGSPASQSVLRQIRLWPNQIDRAEKTSLEQLALHIQPPDDSNHVAGNLQFEDGGERVTLHILPDRNVQEFVAAVGRSLIPEYQRALPEGDRAKVDFRFCVVHLRGVDLELSRVDRVELLAQASGNDVAGAFPGGVIVIPDTTLAGIRNQAQLAAILSSAITVVLQGRDYPTPSPHGWANILTSFAATAPCYQDYCPPDYEPLMFPLTTEEQMLRIGIRQMYVAGYDIREAPSAWAGAAGEPFTNPVTEPARLTTDVPWFAACAFDYISRFYSGVDYSRLKRGQAEYAQLLQELHKSDPDAFVKDWGIVGGPPY
ncbi:MAG TPA: hypothetical protein VME18_03005 [Acidobacteriaceae bacterium]|nr:hypothetical protein [Acidobacteriaceae bacterium]